MNKIGVLGKIEKNSLINYFNKYEFISFHKLFPKLMSILLIAQER